MKTFELNEVTARALAAAQEVQSAPARVRDIAFDAVCYVLPDANPLRIALRLGFPSPGAARDIVSAAKRRHWWDDSHVDHVIGSLVTTTRDGTETFDEPALALGAA